MSGNGVGRGRLELGEMVRLMRRIIAENGRDYARSWALAGVCLVLVALSTAFSAWIMKDVIDEIFYKGRGDLILLIAGAIAAAFFIRGLASYGQAVVLARVGNDLVARYQRRLFDHLLRLDIGFFTDTRSGQLAARISENVNGIRDVLSITITSIARDLVSLVALLAVMISQDPLLSLIALLIAPPLLLTVSYISRRVRRVAREAVTLNSHVTGTMQEAVQGIAVVKAFTMEEQLKAKIGALIERAQNRADKIASVSERTTPISDMLAGLAIAGVIAWGGWRTIAYQQPPGSMFAFISALLFAYDPARRLARLQVNLERAMVNARMIYEVLDIRPRQRDRADATDLAVDAGEIRFEHVDFSYQPGFPVLEDVSFTAGAGKVTAIVGASGAGKSTVIALLLRFHDVASGRISIDGRDIAGVTKASLRANIAYVSQQPWLFEGTIADNIRYGRPDASDEEVRAAAALAHADTFIREQAQGYDTPVGETGATLSGGQRQRLSIARAILRDAPILLLDEATSALDNESEKLVQNALETVMRGRTTIVIAHRLSTIRNADRIVVLDHGRVVEEGDHASLAGRRNGVYARFNMLQGGAEPHEDNPATGRTEGALP